MDEKTKPEKVEKVEKAKPKKVEPTEVAMIKSGVTRIYPIGDMDAKKSEGWEVK